MPVYSRFSPGIYSDDFVAACDNADATSEAAPAPRTVTSETALAPHAVTNTAKNDNTAKDENAATPESEEWTIPWTRTGRRGWGPRQLHVNWSDVLASPDHLNVVRRMCSLLVNFVFPDQAAADHWTDNVRRWVPAYRVAPVYKSIEDKSGPYQSYYPRRLNAHADMSFQGPRIAIEDRPTRSDIHPGACNADPEAGVGRPLGCITWLEKFPDPFQQV